MKRLTLFWLLLAIIILPKAMMAQTLIYSEDFENTSSLPPGWIHSTSGAVTSQTSTPHGGSKSLKFSGANPNVVVMPDLGVEISNVLLTFWERPQLALGNTPGDFDLGYITDPNDSSTFVQVMTWNYSKGFTYEEHVEITFAGAPIGSRIAFRHRPNKTTAYWFVDDIEVYQSLPCKAPTELFVSDLTTTNANLNWGMTTSGLDNPTYFQIEVIDEYGDTVYVNHQVPGTYSQLTLTGLNANTTYSLRMRGDCDLTYSGYSAWSSFTFTTACNILNVPYTENFDDVNDLPDCTTSHNAQVSSSVRYGSFGKSLQLSATGDNAYIVFPLVNCQANNLQFSAMIQSNVSTSLPYTVGIVTDATDIEGTFELLFTDTLNDTQWHDIVMNTSLASVSNIGTSICVFVPGGKTASLYIDEVDIRPIPTCQRPMQFHGYDVTQTSYTLAWSSANTSTCLVEIVNMTDSTVVYQTATSSPYTVTGLLPQTHYRFRICNICSANDSSQMTSYIETQTLCNPFSNPVFFEGAESTTRSSLPECWTYGWWNRQSSGTTYDQPFQTQTSTKHSGLRAFELRSMASGCVSYLTSPGMIINNANEYEVSIWVYRSQLPRSIDEGIHLWLSNNADNIDEGSNAVDLGFINRSPQNPPVEAGNGWYNYVYPITLTGTVYLIIEGDSKYGASTYFDDVEVRRAPTCIKPDGLNVSELSDSSVTLSWQQSASNPASYAVAYTLKKGNPTVASDSVEVTGNNFMISGLDANTTYSLTARIYAVCSATDRSDAVKFSYSFKTPCRKAVIPYEENFESYLQSNIPECWDISASTSSSTAFTPSYIWNVYTYNGNKMLRMDNSIVQPGSACITSPIINLPEGAGYDLEFDYSHTASCGDMKVSVSTDNGETYTVIGTYSKGAGTSNTDPGLFNNEYISLSQFAGNDIILKFSANASYGSGAIYLDNVSINIASPCPKLQASLGLIADTAAEFIVSENCSWQISFGLPGIDPNDGNIVDVTNSINHTITGLNPMTEYVAYVRRVCDTIYGVWSKAVPFRTDCSIVFPYSTSFDNMVVGDVPLCWDIAGTVTPTTTASYLWSVYNFNGNNCVRLYNAFVQTGQACLNSPTIRLAAGGNYKFEFSHSHVADCGNVEVQISTDGGFSYNTIYSIPASGIFSPVDPGIFNDVEIDISSYAGYDINVRFLAYTNNSWGSIFIDNVGFNIDNGCAKLTGSVANIQDSSADVVISDSCAWEVSYGPVGTSADDGTLMSVPTGTTIKITGLSSQTAYVAYVRRICSDSTYGAWSKAISFKTLCGTVSLPYIEGFETTDYASIPDCWTVGTSSSQVTVYATGNYGCVHDGTQSLYFDAFSGLPTDWIVAVLPNVANWHTGEMKFFYTNASGSLGFNDALVFGYLTTMGDVNSFVPFQNLPYASEMTEVNISLADLPANAVSLAFKYIGWYNGAVDDISIVAGASCPKLGVSLTNVRDVSADIVINDTCAWQYVYGLSGSVDTLIATPISVPAGSKLAHISGLTEATAYNVYVRRQCDVDEFGVWSKAVSFKTTLTPSTLPLITGFENDADNMKWEFVNGTGNNNLVIGIDANGVSSGSKSLYVSNDNNTYTYSVVNSSQSFAYRTIEFNAAKYSVSFRWKCTGGEYDFDFGSVMIIPTSELLIGGTGDGYPPSFPNYMFRMEPEIYKPYFNLTNGDADGWNTYTGIIDMSANPGIYNFVVMWNNNGSIGTPSFPFAMDDLRISEITCDAPSVMASGTSSDTTIIQCASSDATEWEIAVSTTPIDVLEIVVGDIRQVVTSNPVSITGLTPNTEYYYTARAICAPGDTSDWANVQIVRTACSAYDVPYYESFENVDALNCWSSFGYFGPVRTNVYHYDGTASLMISDGAAVSPELNIQSSMETYMVNGYAYSTADNTTFAIGVMVDPGNSETYEIVDQKVITTHGQWQEFTTYFTILGDEDYEDFVGAKHFVLVVGGDATVYFDNIAFGETSNCQKPTDVVVSNVLSHSFDIAWTDNAGVSSWVVKAVPMFGNTIEHVVTTNPATITGLNAQTQYSVSIASICSATDTSYEKSCGMIKTACDVIELPYIETFEAMIPNTVPDCWDNSMSTASSMLSNPRIWNVYNYNSNNTIRMWNGIVTQSGSAIINTPFIAIPTGAVSELAFDYTNNASCGPLNLQVSSDNGATFTTLDSYASNTDNGNQNDPGVMTHVTIPLNAYAGDTIMIRFSANASFGSGAMFVDNIAVTQNRICNMPTGVTETNVTDSQIDITWTPGGSETQWIVSIQKAGQLAETTIVDTTSVSFTGLDPMTQYLVSIAAICGTNDTSYFTVPLSVRTACVTITAPWYENFDTYDAGIIIDCWDNSTSTSSSTIYDPSFIWGVYNFNNNNMLRMYNSYVQNGTALINTPLIALPNVAGTELLFKYSNSADCGDFLVKISDDGGQTFSTIGQYAAQGVTSSSDPGTWIDAVINLDNYKGNNVMLQFYAIANNGSGAIFIDDIQIIPGDVCRNIDNDPTVVTTTATTIVVSVQTRPLYDEVLVAYGPLASTISVADTVASVHSTNGTAVISGLTPSTAYRIWVCAICNSGDSTAWTNPVTAITHASDCFEPQNIAVVGIPTDVTATVAWVSAPDAINTEWNLIVGSTLVGNGFTTGDTMVFNNLSQSTNYTFKIRSICSVGDTSNWATVNFATTAALAPLPYVCDFENSTENNQWNMINGSQVNKFFIGNATSVTGNSLYISNNSGDSYAYDNSRTSYSYATRLLQLPAGMYEYSYDWNCNGEGSTNKFDYGRVLLVPDNIIPVSGIPFANDASSGPTGSIPLDLSFTSGYGLNRSSDWMSEFGTFTVPAIGNYQLVICWINDMGNGSNPPFAIDNIHIAALTCPQPSVIVSATTQTSATFNINNIANIDTIVYAISTGSFDDAIIMDTLVNQNSVTVEGLSASTGYVFYAKAICGEGDESNLTSVSFRTVCGIVSLPYTESFEELPSTYTVGMIDDICWHAHGASTSSSVRPNYIGGRNTAYISDGHSCLYMYSSSSQNMVFVLPDFGDVANAQVSFASRVENVSLSGTIQVGYITNPSVMSTFVPVFSTPKTTALASYTANILDIPVGARIAFAYVSAYSNNACASIDNICVLQLVSGNTYYDTVCHNTPFVDHGFNIPAGQMTDGDNTFTRIKPSGSAAPDTIVTANVFMSPQISITYYDTVCAGVPYVTDLFNIPSPSSRSYFRTFQSSEGCDTMMVTLNLTVENSYVDLFDTICEGDVYSFNGQQITIAGDYMAYGTTTRGCLDTTVLHLYVVAAHDTVTETICYGTSYVWHGQTYNTAGTYTWTGEGSYGCDLTSTLILTVVGGNISNDISICAGGSYLFRDTLITTAGTYSRTYYVANIGCYVTETIVVTIDDILVGDVYDIACEGHLYSGYSINDLTVTKDTVISISSKTYAMCDSVTNVHLTYIATKYGDEYVTIVNGESYEWHDNTYTKPGDYRDTMPSADGCDSIAILHLSVGSDVENISAVQVDVVPNPVALGMVAYIYGEFGEIEVVEILNNFGQVVSRFVPSTYPIEVEGLEAEGLYYVRIITRSYEIYTEKLLVK